MADDALLEVASALAEGSAIDWDNIEQHSGGEAERTVVRELRQLALIVRAMRGDVSQTDLLDTGQRTAPMADEPTVGQWGHLRVLEEIGQGSYGVVHRAWDTRLECDVALKLVEASGVSRAFDDSSALKEARLLARVRHPNVVKVYGADCHDGRFGLWMELVAGRTLEQVLAVQGRMSAREVAQVGIDLCQALAAVHGAGLLHRDLKATNVMREDGGRILLMDFGTGRPIPTADDHVKGIAGTPLYLAPELFSGANPSAASDIYSLGVLLDHLVTGSYPVHGEHWTAIGLAHRRRERRLLRDARPDLPSAFIDVIERALSFSPENRYPTAGAFGNALSAVTGIASASHEPAPLPPAAPAENGSSSQKSTPKRIVWPLHWKRIAATVAVVVALVTAARLARTPSQLEQDLTTDAPAPPIVDRSPAAGGTMPATYQVEASFHALRDGQRTRLAAGSRVSPGDRLFLTLDVSRPVFVYVVNQDEQGATYLLFPLPGQQLTNPVEAGQNQLPGPREGNEVYWEVSSAGGREHFFVYVTPERQDTFETLLASLPRAELGRPVTSAPLNRDAVGVLRAVGGLTTAGPPAASGLPALTGLQLLPQGPDPNARGLWARQITLDNPAR